MPSVYEYHHVELDKVGKGKRVLKPPGGGCSDIFGGGGQSPTENGGGSGATTPTGRRSSDFGFNTKDRLFGGEANGGVDSATNSPRRASIDRMKSNIFSGGDQVDSSPKNGSAKKFARRNPITGDIEEIKEEKTNGTNGHHVNGNGMLANGHSVEDQSPVQQQSNVRVRKPPGGESSGIF